MGLITILTRLHQRVLLPATRMDLTGTHTVLLLIQLVFIDILLICIIPTQIMLTILIIGTMELNIKERLITEPKNAHQKLEHILILVLPAVIQATPPLLHLHLPARQVRRAAIPGLQRQPRRRLRVKRELPEKREQAAPSTSCRHMRWQTAGGVRRNTALFKA